MRRILILIAIIATTLTASTATAQGNGYKPYVGLGTSVSSGVTSIGGEVGLYNNKAWYAVGLSSASSQKGSYYLSPKGYWKLTNVKADNKFDAFAYGAVNLALDRTHSLSVEPGVSIVWNALKKFAPQFTLSFPVGENSVLRERPLQVNAGISLNYWIK